MGHGSVSEYSALLYQINVENSQEGFRESLPTYPPFPKNPLPVTVAGMASPRMEILGWTAQGGKSLSLGDTARCDVRSSSVASADTMAGAQIGPISYPSVILSMRTIAPLRPLKLVKEW